MLRFFAFRAGAGTEEVSDGAYRRTIRGGGILQITDEGGALRTTFWGAAPDDAVVRVRRMFDLDADLVAVAAHLSRDPAMAPLVAARPALRIPGGWDPFEIALRTVLGQQVSVVAARLLNARLVERCGKPLDESPFSALSRVFPTPEAVVDADLSAMGMPGARVATLKAVAAAYLDDPSLFERGDSVEETVARLRRVKGVGEWTAQYIAMRACREPDAFPAGDVGLLRGMADVDGVRPRPADLLARAEAWRPYRAYAAHHIWAADPVEIPSLPRPS